MTQLVDAGHSTDYTLPEPYAWAPGLSDDQKRRQLQAFRQMWEMLADHILSQGVNDAERRPAA